MLRLFRLSRQLVGPYCGYQLPRQVDGKLQMLRWFLPSRIVTLYPVPEQVEVLICNF